MKITVAEALIRMLEYENVSIIFGYPGAATCPIYDNITKSNIKHILMRQEQSCAHAASGYARISNKVGVCLATSGPGATNLITGIATAYMDSIPIVAITGQVPTDQIGKDVFQEVDTTGATAPFCKHNYLVKDAEKVPQIIHEAFYISSTGRPGPVIIDIPLDIQKEVIDFEYPDEIRIRGYNPTHKGHGLQIKRIADALAESKKPVICAGGGVITANASEDLSELSEKVGIPVTNTLMGKGCICESHENYMGMVGSHGTEAANRVINEADLLIVMGARAGDRATKNSNKFAHEAKIVHIDIDPAEIGKNLGTNIPVVGDLKTILNQLKKVLKAEYKKEWIEEARRMKKGKTIHIDNNSEYVNPKYVLQVLSKITKGEAIITTEVGQNQIWAANYFECRYPRTFISSGGLGTMGYGLPAAIGAKIADKNKEVFVISGDGSLQMNMQEMASLIQWDVKVVIILFNNSSLGMVRELQKINYDKNYCAVDIKGPPDFIKLADAYGIKAKRVRSNIEVEESLKEAINHNGSYLIEYIVDPEESTL